MIGTDNLQEEAGLFIKSIKRFTGILTRRKGMRKEKRPTGALAKKSKKPKRLLASTIRVMRLQGHQIVISNYRPKQRMTKPTSRTIAKHRVEFKTVRSRLLVSRTKRF